MTAVILMDMGPIDGVSLQILQTRLLLPSQLCNRSITIFTNVSFFCAVPLALGVYPLEARPLVMLTSKTI